MIRLAWQKKHLPFFDRYVSELAFIYSSEQHSTFVLIEPFLATKKKVFRNSQAEKCEADLRFVDVIILPFVRTTNHHYSEIATVVQTEIVHRRLQ